MKRLFTTLAVITILMLACKKDKKTVAALTTAAATNITANGFTAGGNITDDGNSAITKRGIAWSDHTNPTVGDSITNNGTGTGSFTTNLTGLNANTTYYIRAYAINASGTGYGNEISVKTSAGAPTVATSAISNIQPLSAVTGGNVTNDGGASITERGVVYATTANPTINNYKIAVGTGTGNFTATLSPLASQTTYYVRAYATNSFGTAYGNQVQFNAASANTVTDIDGNVYPYITIGAQSWMAVNLKVTKFKNGDVITNGLSGYNWGTQPTPAYSFPNGAVTKKDTLGLLYNLTVANDSRGVCPSGWHVPTDNDWKILEVNQGMPQATADLEDAYPGRGTIGAKLLEGGSSGLNIQKAGMVYVDNGNATYAGFNDWGLYWTSTTASVGLWWRGFNFGSPDAGPIVRTNVDNSYVMSIRCIKD